MKSNKPHHKKSRLFTLGLCLLGFAAGLQVVEMLPNKPTKAEQTQKYQIPEDRPPITDLNQKR